MPNVLFLDFRFVLEKKADTCCDLLANFICRFFFHFASCHNNTQPVRVTPSTHIALQPHTTHPHGCTNSTRTFAFLFVFFFLFCSDTARCAAFRTCVQRSEYVRSKRTVERGAVRVQKLAQIHAERQGIVRARSHVTFHHNTTHHLVSLHLSRTKVATKTLLVTPTTITSVLSSSSLPCPLLSRCVFFLLFLSSPFLPPSSPLCCLLSGLAITTQRDV